MSSRFDGRVAIVTGAGGGLGREYATLLASLGARVVVNDLATETASSGESGPTTAQRVVDEIRSQGGEAVANHYSVKDGARIVDTALEAFGGVDIVVNNAGILRDKSYNRMDQSDWDAIYQVHLQGSHSVTHAAWPHLIERGYGRIVMTSSAAGIYGNFGQANYAAAKLGLYGLCRTLAVEGSRYGIQVNTIAPIARSRLTEDIFPPEVLERVGPQYVSPLVAWLCHEECKETGGLYEVGAGYMSKLRWERAGGHCFSQEGEISVDSVRDRWADITDFSDSEHPSDNISALTSMFSRAGGPA